MALTSSEVKEIETIVRKEIRNFIGNNTVKQFEDKMIEKIEKEIKNGKLNGDIKDITLRIIREINQFIWMNQIY